MVKEITIFYQAICDVLNKRRNDNMFVVKKISSARWMKTNMVFFSMKISLKYNIIIQLSNEQTNKLSNFNIVNHEHWQHVLNYIYVGIRWLIMSFYSQKILRQHLYQLSNLYSNETIKFYYLSTNNISTLHKY